MGKVLGLGLTAMMVVAVAGLPQQSPAAPEAKAMGTAAEVPPVRRARPQARQTASLDLAGAKVEVVWGPAPAKGRDFDAVDELESGAVVQFTGTSAIKLLTSADLLFGETRVARGNAAPDYPGVYGLWIERAEDGWRLVFNHKADVWGTRYDPSADSGRVGLAHETAEAAVESFHAELAAGDGTSGLLVLSWGSHRWSVPFRLAAE